MKYITKSDAVAISTYLAKKYASLGIKDISVDVNGNIVITYVDDTTSTISGDLFMVKSVYDVFNRGKVDLAQNSERLAGQLSAYYTNSGNILYDNTLSGLTADDVKEAIDELVDMIANIPQPPLSAGIVHQPTFTNNGNGTVTLGDAVVNLFIAEDFNDKIQRFNVTGGTFTPLNNTNSYLVVDYNNGNPIYKIIASNTLINESTIIPVYTFYRIDNTVMYLNWDRLGIGLSNKMHQRFVFTRRFERESGLAISESPTRIVTISSGIVWYGAVRNTLQAVVSNVDSCHLHYHVGGVYTFTDVTQYNNTQYDNGTSLVGLGPNRYTVNWIYRNVEDGKHMEILLGDAQYNSVAAAIEAQPRLDLPDVIKSNCMLIGRIIVQRNATTAANIASAFDVTFVSVPVNNHNDLAGIQGGSASQYYHLTATQHDDLLATRFWALLGTPANLSVTTEYQKILNTDTTKIPEATSSYFTLSEDKKDITCIKSGVVRITRTVTISSLSAGIDLFLIPTINGTQTAQCTAQEQQRSVTTTTKDIGYSYYLSVNAGDVISLWAKGSDASTLTYVNARTTVEYI